MGAVFMLWPGYVTDRYKGITLCSRPAYVYVIELQSIGQFILLESVDLSNLPTLTQADKNKKDAGFIHSHSFVQSTGNIGSFHNWLFYETRLEDINLDKNRMQKIFHWWRLRHKTTAIIVMRHTSLGKALVNIHFYT